MAVASLLQPHAHGCGQKPDLLQNQTEHSVWDRTDLFVLMQQHRLCQTYVELGANSEMLTRLQQIMFLKVTFVTTLLTRGSTGRGGAIANNVGAVV